MSRPKKIFIIIWFLVLQLEQWQWQCLQAGLLLERDKQSNAENNTLEVYSDSKLLGSTHKSKFRYQIIFQMIPYRFKWQLVKKFQPS